MVYAVGVPTHVAIGTSAVAVAANAVANLIPHARAGTVKWQCAGVFAAALRRRACGGTARAFSWLFESVRVAAWVKIDPKLVSFP
jgi:uncharacterized membrane protein YfcA